MAALGTPERPLRVAIVGSGPSGFYAADPLLKGDIHCTVDMFDRLPTPYGLVRGGVAPDHPKIRSVTKVYEKIAAREGFRFFGHVTIGRDILVEELRQHYDAIVFATGAETDRRMHVPGEDLPGSHTATSFVGWYNGHPDHRDIPFDLSHEVAVVVGVGNVAMDVARILAKTADELKETDIAKHALEVLAESKVREVHIIGRRGPAQAKFTAAELKEMGHLADADPVVDPAVLVLDPESAAQVESDPGTRRNMELMQEFAQRTPDPGKHRRVFFDFLLSPLEIQGEHHVEAILFERNRLELESGEHRAIGTGETKLLPCNMVFRSIGYRGVAIPGTPFDERRCVIPNVSGRVMDEGVVVPGMYVAGWIKRGPSGVIGTNKPDSLETVQALLEDVPRLPGCVEPSPEAIPALLARREVRYVSFEEWALIDAAEVAAGARTGKPRERFTRIPEMLEVIEMAAQSR